MGSIEEDADQDSMVYCIVFLVHDILSSTRHSYLLLQ